MAVWTAFVLSTLAVYLSVAEGAENFDFKTQICCNGTVYKRFNNTGCCGKQAIDLTEFACCNHKQVVPRLPGVDPSWQVCCYEHPSGYRPYDARTHECCGGIIPTPSKVRPINGYGCCGGHLFDSKEQLCCENKLVARQWGDQCCGAKVYNTHCQVCCRKPVKQGEMWVEYSNIFDQKSHHTSCCGLAVFDSSSEVCCYNGNVLALPANVAPDNAACCGDAVIDQKTQLCCQPLDTSSGAAVFTVLEKKDPSTRCCGLDLYNSYEQACCGGTVLTKPEGVDKEAWTQCCGTEIQTNFESQLCHNGRLVARNSTSQWTCGEEGKIYDSKTQGCCVNEVLENADGELCCHTVAKPYKYKKEACCSDTILPLTDEDISEGKLDCCSSFKY